MTSKNLIIVGAGGHAKSVSEIAIKLGFYITGYLDDFSNEPNVIGKLMDIPKYSNHQFVMGIGGITNLDFRNQIIEHFKPFHHQFINLVSPHALISSNVKMGIGNTVHPFAFVNQEVEIKNFCIINTRAIVEHDCKIGNNVHISTGAIVNGNVMMGDNVFIGSGALIKNNVSICSNVIIGMGSVVLHSIHEPGTYVGNPLKKIK
jgi:sugar O-acyltransferase (sialic acid O-acetyltransferase NeuD family)